MEFEEKFVAFIDVLGFKSMVAEAEAGHGRPLHEILDILAKLGTSEDSKQFETYGPTVCPESQSIRKDLNFKVLQISDCTVVSAEISPAGVINLISHSWKVVTRLLIEGVLCRGYITKGPIYQSENQVIGSGYHNAYAMESGVSAFKKEADELGTPFVEIDPVVCDYIQKHSDECVQKMFTRYTKSDHNVTALFPFHRFQHSFVIGGIGNQEFNPQKEKQSNNIVRERIIDFIERVQTNIDPNNTKALMKINYYISALEEQLAVCDKTDEMIDNLCSPFPRNI